MARSFSRLHLVLALLSAAVAQAATAAEIEAKKDGVEVYAGATNKSDVLVKLKEGESLPSGERKGMFWQVTTKDGKAGFVSVLTVKRKAEANGDLAKAIKSVIKEGRENGDNNESRTRSAVMGVRGLAPDDNMANAANVRPNLHAVYQMEDTRDSAAKTQALGAKVYEEIETKSDVK